MIAISANNLSKTFGITTLFEDVQFNINQGDKIGLIGRNGAGKTTLFKLLTGDYTPDTGSLFFGKGLTVGYLEQIPVAAEDTSLYDYCLEIFRDLLDQEASLRAQEHEIAAFGKRGEEPPATLLSSYASSLDNFSHNRGYSFRSEVKGVLRGLGFEEDEFERPIHQLSGGQKSRLGIGRLLLKRLDILLLDEPTNHLDIDACAWLESFLRSYNGTLILISHDRYFLDQIVSSIFEMENGNLTTYTGNYSSYVIQKEMQYETAVRTFENQQKEIQKQEEIIRRFKGHGTEKLAKRARSRERMLEKIEISDKPLQYTKRTKLHLSTRLKSGEDVLHVEQLSMAYGDRHLFSNVDFRVQRGECIGLIGSNGIGKTTLFKLIAQELSPKEGFIKIGHQVEIGIYDQEQSNLNPHNDLVEEISDAYPILDTTEIRGLLGGFLFQGDDVFKKIHQLSGGERGRVSLLKLMLSEKNFLLLDEPTNHLDIESKEALEDALLGYDGTIITISHDRYFLNKVCSKILHLNTEGMAEYLGNYDYYKEKSAVLNAPPIIEEPAKTKTQAKEDRKKEKEKQQAIRSAKQTVMQIEKRIAELETELEDIQGMLCEEHVYSDAALMVELSDRTANIESELAQLYEDWETHL